MQHAESQQRKTSGPVHFLICEACFWCASYLGTDVAPSCPLCKIDPVESIPISSNEQYRFDYHPKRGVTLEFSAIEY